jgi:phytoene/squalene synthetase
VYVPVYLADIHYGRVYIDSEEMGRDAVAHFPAAKYVVAAMLKSLIKESAAV